MLLDEALRVFWLECGWEVAEAGEADEATWECSSVDWCKISSCSERAPKRDEEADEVRSDDRSACSGIVEVAAAGLAKGKAVADAVGYEGTLVR